MADENSSGGGKGILIVLIALIVILMVGMGGAFWAYTQGMFGSQDDKEEESVNKKESSNDGKEFFRSKIEDLVLNITDSKGRGKLMKLSFEIKTVEPTIEAIIEKYKAEIVDVVINQISARSSEELLTVAGKELLKEELIQELNSVINDNTVSDDDISKNVIKNIYFTSFVIK